MKKSLVMTTMLFAILSILLVGCKQIERSIPQSVEERLKRAESSLRTIEIKHDNEMYHDRIETFNDDLTHSRMYIDRVLEDKENYNFSESVSIQIDERIEVIEDGYLAFRGIFDEIRHPVAQERYEEIHAMIDRNERSLEAIEDLIRQHASGDGTLKTQRTLDSTLFSFDSGRDNIRKLVSASEGILFPEQLVSINSRREEIDERWINDSAIKLRKLPIIN